MSRYVCADCLRPNEQGHWPACVRAPQSPPESLDVTRLAAANRVQAERIVELESRVGNRDEIAWLLSSALNTLSMRSHPNWRARAYTVLERLCLNGATGKDPRSLEADGT